MVQMTVAPQPQIFKCVVSDWQKCFWEGLVWSCWRCVAWNLKSQKPMPARPSLSLPPPAGGSDVSSQLLSQHSACDLVPHYDGYGVTLKAVSKPPIKYFKLPWSWCLRGREVSMPEPKSHSIKFKFLITVAFALASAGFVELTFRTPVTR